MPRYIIERNMSGAGEQSRQDLQDAANKSCSVMEQLHGLSWVNSYVTGDCIYCIFDATDESLIREHSEKTGFPADRIAEVKNVFDPTWRT